MTSKPTSKNHHWWPVGLQRYWADRAGDISWIGPDGLIGKKRAANRKIGYKKHGHTIFRGSEWENNFENEFEIDNEVHSVVSALNELKPFGRTPAEFYTLVKLLLNKKRTLRDACKFHHMEEKLHRNLLLLIYSLLMRSPANRSRYESYATIAGLPPNEEIGKGNMQHNYVAAKKLCQHSSTSNQYFVLLQSPMKKFIFGDGNLDWLTNGLHIGRINGRALIPLTPQLCVYFCTPMAMRTSPNCASLSAAPWMVDWVNEITQIYSRDKLFFQGRAPKLTEAFSQRSFLEHKFKTDALLDMLDEVAGIKKYQNVVGLGLGGLI